MRFVPLISSSLDPGPWQPFAGVALQWDGALHRAWSSAAMRCAVPGVVLRPTSSLEDGLQVLRHGLTVDFLVLPTRELGTREARFRLLGTLEALLEATAPRGVKLALRMEAAAQAEALAALKEARGEAVGFCWHEGTRDLEALADRLWFALGAQEADLAPLQTLGYRWDVALPAPSPEAFRLAADSLSARFPAVLFPAVMPATALGRPVVKDENVVLGRHWDRS